MDKQFSFSTDYIEIITDDDDILIFTPVYSNKLGLYLYNEDEKPIKDILLLNSELIYNYVTGEKKLTGKNVLSVKIEDKHFKRRMKENINNNLFKYSVNDALFYDLDVKQSIEYGKNKTKKKIK